MSGEVIESALESIDAVKVGLLQIDPATGAIRQRLDDAFRSLSEAAAALRKVVTVDAD